MRDLLQFLSCNDPATFLRLEAETTLAGAWARATDPGDLVWLAVRVAHTAIDRILVADAIVACLELGAGASDTEGREALQEARALLDELYPAVEAGGRAPAPENLNGHVNILLQESVRRVRSVSIAIDRRRLRHTDPLTEHAIYVGLEGTRLVLLGGWKTRAADQAKDALREITKLAPAVDLPAELRSRIPFLDFRTSWHDHGPIATKAPVRAPRAPVPTGGLPRQGR